jgi:hypothetical protein
MEKGADSTPLHDKYSAVAKLWTVLSIFGLGIAQFSLISLMPAHKTPLFLTGFLLCFIGMLGLRAWWPNTWGATHLMIIAVFARLLLLPIAPSDDLNRYLWEGTCQGRGINPYAIAPDHPRTEPLRDTIWQGINHKEFTTIYGPLAQIVFRIAAAIHYSPLMLKVTLLMFDSATLLLLLGVLQMRGARMNEAILYALNPLVLYAFAAEGHVESLMLCMLAGAILMYRKKHYARMFFLLGCAASVKLTALMFIPLFVRRDTLRSVPAVLLPALMALPYGIAVGSIFVTTARFGTEFHFNGCLYNVLAMAFSHRECVLAGSIAFLSIYCAVFFLTPDPVRASGTVAIAFLLTAPTTHAWYFTIVAMYAVLFPVRSWITLSATAGLSWLVIFHYWVSGIWKEWVWIFLVEYVPPALIAFSRRWIGPEFRSPGFGAPGSLSIVIPTLNEAEHLRECLASIQVPDTLPGEILVVDGGSGDATVSIASADKRVKVLSAARGRGIQIAHGVAANCADLVIIVHADTRLCANSIQRIVDFCNRHQGLGGGSIATSFDSKSPRFAFITALNNLRVRLTGISFGDQVQFFRRAALRGTLPAVKIMEDVELALLLKERGVVAVAPAQAHSSIRRWQKSSYSRNMFMVIGLTAAYLVRRRLGLLKPGNNDFYQAYYGK